MTHPLMRLRLPKWHPKIEPVAWLTTASVVGGALLEADRQYHVLPGSWGHWLGFAVVGAGLIVAGRGARKASTPVADPQSAAGEPLIPLGTPHGPGAGTAPGAGSLGA